MEVGFPATLNVSSLESKPEWKIEEKKDTKGSVIGAILIGSIPTGKSESFRFTAQNPNAAGMLLLKVIQIYEDGTRSEWTGEAGTRTPAPSVEILKK